MKSLCFLLKIFVVAGSLAFTAGKTLSTEDGTPQIVGGVEANVGEFPSLVFLAQYYGDTVDLEAAVPRQTCGGTIINSNSILTAAHCCEHDDDVIVAGAHDKTKRDENWQERKVTKKILHPKYNPDSATNDVCILKLDKPLTFNKRVQPVKLATKTPNDGSIVTTAGWGYICEDGPDSDVLRKVDVRMMNHKSCKKIYENRDAIDESMICAAKMGKDSCQGDSGGILTQGQTQVGVVSWGIGCARDEYPGVYANVAGMLPWIQGVARM